MIQMIFSIVYIRFVSLYSFCSQTEIQLMCDQIIEIWRLLSKLVTLKKRWKKKVEIIWKLIFLTSKPHVWQRDIFTKNQIIFEIRKPHRRDVLHRPEIITIDTKDWFELWNKFLLYVPPCNQHLYKSVIILMI